MFNREWQSLIYEDFDLSDRFLISNDGLLFSLKTNKILKQHINKQGYYVYATSLGKRGKYKLIKIHRAVAFMFVGGYKKGLVVNHKDGNKTNNLYTNLEWVTHKENTQHALNHNLYNPYKPIICNQTQQVFKSINEACEWCGIKYASMNDYLHDLNNDESNRKRKSSGKHPITGEKLTWSYL